MLAHASTTGRGTPRRRAAAGSLPTVTILYYTILYYTILYYTILYYTILYHTYDTYIYVYIHTYIHIHNSMI